MKETAVEWLEKIRHGQKGQPFDDYEWEIAFNHAKEMEKEQINDACYEGYYQRNSGNMSLDIRAYYDKKYKNEKT